MEKNDFELPPVAVLPLSFGRLLSYVRFLSDSPLRSDLHNKKHLNYLCNYLYKLIGVNSTSRGSDSDLELGTMVVETQYIDRH